MQKWLIPCAAVAALLAGCTPQQNAGESALGTNVPLASASNLTGAAPPGTQVWRAPDIAQYPATDFYIPPVKVDTGAEARFTGVDPQQIAAMLTADVRRAVGQRFRVVNTPGPGTHSLELTLVQLVPPQPMYISNGPYPWAQAIVGMPNANAATGGQMLVAGKSVIPATGKLLAAFVVPVTPRDLMMGVPSGSGGAMVFARDASQDFASSLAASLARQQELNRQVSQQ
jgi:hypothetical protein